jgi:hypothetical protein
LTILIVDHTDLTDKRERGKRRLPQMNADLHRWEREKMTGGGRGDNN